MLNLSSEQRQQYPHRIEYLDQPLHKKLPHSALTAIVFCFKQKSSIMFFSLVVLSLFLASGRAASDLDPNTEGEDEMEFAVVSLKFSSIKFFQMLLFSMVNALETPLNNKTVKCTLLLRLSNVDCYFLIPVLLFDASTIKTRNNFLVIFCMIFEGATATDWKFFICY